MHVIPYVVHSVFPVVLCGHNNWGWQGTGTSGQKSWELLRLLLTPPHLLYFFPYFHFQARNAKRKCYFILSHHRHCCLCGPVVFCLWETVLDGSAEGKPRQMRWHNSYPSWKSESWPTPSQAFRLCVHWILVWINSPQLINQSTIAANVCVLRQNKVSCLT